MQAYTLFISDLHLQHEAPDITEKFRRFLQTEAANADALYILGDFFETWIGDDDYTPFNQQIAEQLKQLVTRGTPIYFMHGNRDFLIGQRFMQHAHIQLLPDPSVITLYGKKIVLSHGDILCTLDTRHQKYRRFALHPFCQKLFLSIPLWLRRKIADSLRRTSYQHNRQTPRYITDVTVAEAERLAQKNEASLLIHGHTHRPRVHLLENGYRIVLGAWHDQADFLRLYSDGHFELCPFH